MAAGERVPLRMNDRHVPKLFKLTSITISNKVLGVALLNDKLYVLPDLENGCNLLVYDCRHNTFQQCQDVIVKYMNTVSVISGIAVCSSNQCLYASDSRNQCILRLRDEGRTVIRWLNNWKQCLSVSSRGRVLLWNTTRPKLFVYSSHGALLQSLDIPGVSSLRHAIQAKSGTLIYCGCGRDANGDNTVNRVHSVGVSYSGDGSNIVLRTSDIRQTFAVALGVGEDRESARMTLALDSNEYLFVPDAYNHRIIVVNRRFEVCRVMATHEWGHGGKPKVTCFSSGLLVVGVDCESGTAATANGGRVDVFTLGYY